MRAALVIIGDLVKKRAEQERLNSGVRTPAIRRFLGAAGWSRAIKNWPGRFGLNEAMGRRTPAMGAHRGPDGPVSGSRRTKP